VDSAWTYQQKLVAPDGVADDTFGVSVAFYAKAKRIIVGAYLDDDTYVNAGFILFYCLFICLVCNFLNENFIYFLFLLGSVYTYKLVNSVWTFQSKMLAFDGAKNDFYGLGLGAWDTTVVVGAMNADATAGDDNTGNLFILFTH
jgi:hypothetical protein